MKKHNPEVVLYGASVIGRDLAPRVASELLTVSTDGAVLGAAARAAMHGSLCRVTVFSPMMLARDWMRFKT